MEEKPLWFEALLSMRKCPRSTQILSNDWRNMVLFSVKYVVAGKDDPSTPIGRGWQFQFSTDDKKVAEERAAKVGLELEWSEDGVRSIAGPIPAIRYDKWRNEKVWFNHMAVSYPMMEKGGGGTTLTFGDGEPLPGEIIHDSIRILEEESVAFLWQTGDVLLIDNWAILHSRRSCNPPRRVLASLCK